MKRVILTGASGFVGGHVIGALREHGFEVHTIGRAPHPDANSIFSEADLLDAKQVTAAVASVQASYLLHLAWYTEPGLYWHSPLNLEWVSASLKLVRAFRDTGGVRVVVAGTCAEYALGSRRLREDALCAPTTLYGAAKDELRRNLDSYVATVGLSFAWGRLFYLYGPGEKRGRLVSDAVNSLLAGERFATSPGHQRRDFMHVEDAGAAFAALLDSEVAGAVNIGSGTAVPVRDILERIGKATGRAGLIDYGERPLATSEPIVVEADITRLLNEVGFRSTYNLDDGLKQTIEWWVNAPSSATTRAFSV